MPTPRRATAPEANTADILDRLISYEEGDLDDDETIEFFRDLRDGNLLGSLQGHYGRTAQALHEAGLL